MAHALQHGRIAHTAASSGQGRRQSVIGLAGIREELEFARRDSDSFARRTSVLDSRQHANLEDPGIEHRFNEKPALRKAKGRSLFADRDQMKAELRARLFKDHYDVRKLYKDRGCSQRIAKSHMFEKLQLLMIVASTVWLGYDTEYNVGDTTAKEFLVMANVFCAFFLLEIIIRLAAFKEKRKAFSDSWFVFDLFLVVLMVIETWVLPIYFTVFDGEISNLSRWSTVLRLVRFARVARFVRLIGSFPELLILFRGMFAAVRSMFFTIVLLVMLAYIFAIAFKLSVPACPSDLPGTDPCRPYNHFEHLPQGMMTLVVQGTLLDGVGNLIQDMVLVATKSNAWYLPIGFLAYVFLSAFTVLNLLIGVICEAVSSVAVIYREETQIEMATEQLREIIIPKWLDGNEDGTISKNMLAEMLLADEQDEDKPGIARSLHKVGVDIIGFVDIADTFFDDRLDATFDGESLLEAHERRESRVRTFNFEQRELTFAELMEIVLNLRGSNAVTVKDLVHHRKLLSRSQSTLVETLHFKIREQLMEALHEFGMHRKHSDTVESPRGLQRSNSPKSSGVMKMDPIKELPHQQVGHGAPVGAAATLNLDLAPSLAPLIAASIAQAEESLREARAKLDEIFAKTSVSATQAPKEPRGSQASEARAKLDEIFAKTSDHGRAPTVPPVLPVPSAPRPPKSANASGRKDATKPLLG